MKTLSAFVLAIALVVLACLSHAADTPATAPAKVIKVVLIAASNEYEAENSLTILKAYLEKNPSIRCTLIKAGDGGTGVPGLEVLDDCDVLIPFMRRVKLQGEQLERFKKYCQSGRAIVGVRTSSHAVQTWLAFDKEVLGGNYSGHFGTGPKTEVRQAAELKDHPVLAGVQEFSSPGSLYKNTGLAKDCQVLQYGQTPGHREPVTWAREYKGGRIVYTSLGHPGDFRNDNFLKMMANAVTWTAGKIVNSE